METKKRHCWITSYMSARYWNTSFRLKLIKFNARCNHHIKIFHLSSFLYFDIVVVIIVVFFFFTYSASNSIYFILYFFFASNKKRMSIPAVIPMKLLTTIFLSTLSFFFSHHIKLSRALPYFCWRSLARNWNANVEGSISAVRRNFVST